MVDGRFTLINGILLDTQTGMTWTLVTAENLDGSASHYGTWFPQFMLSALTPSTGPSIGNTLVTITGVGLVNATWVRFGQTTVAPTDIISDMMLTVATPPGVPGTVPVFVVRVGTHGTPFGEVYVGDFTYT